jgi:hypothetical protein
MTEVEQKYVIRSLSPKKFKLDSFVAELTSVSGEQGYGKKPVEYWIHESR